MEWRRVVLAVLSPKAGLSRAPPWPPEWIVKGANHGARILIPEKNCVWSVV